MKQHSQKSLVLNIEFKIRCFFIVLYWLENWLLKCAINVWYLKATTLFVENNPSYFKSCGISFCFLSHPKFRRISIKSPTTVSTTQSIFDTSSHFFPTFRQIIATTIISSRYLPLNHWQISLQMFKRQIFWITWPAGVSFVLPAIFVHLNTKRWEDMNQKIAPQNPNDKYCIADKYWLALFDKQFHIIYMNPSVNHLIFSEILRDFCELLFV